MRTVFEAIKLQKMELVWLLALFQPYASCTYEQTVGSTAGSSDCLAHYKTCVTEEGARTLDHKVKSLALYQLSYSGPCLCR